MGNVRPGVRKTKMQGPGESRGRHEYAKVLQKMKIPGLVQLFVLLQRTQMEQKEGVEFERPV